MLYDPPMHRRSWNGLILSSALLGGLLACGPKAAELDETTGSGSSVGPATSVADTGGSSSTGVQPTSTTSGDPCVTGCGTATSSSSCSFVGCDSDSDSDSDTAVLCDLFVQDCPDGQKCAPVITDGGSAWNEARCVPVNGDGQPGDDCVAESVVDGLDDCAKGAMCWDVDDQGNGTCFEQCSGSARAPFCANMGLCTISGDGVLNLCLPTCSPLLQDCKVGDACYPVIDHFTCAPDSSGDAGQVNDPCEFVNVCDPGLMCADAGFVGAGCPEGATGCCTPFCDLSKPAACPNPDQQCVAFFDPMNIPPVPADAANIGVCGLPV
jgi:hypothetical protein